MLDAVNVPAPKASPTWIAASVTLVVTVPVVIVYPVPVYVITLVPRESAAVASTIAKEADPAVAPEFVIASEKVKLVDPPGARTGMFVGAITAEAVLPARATDAVSVESTELETPTVEVSVPAPTW